MSKNTTRILKVLAIVFFPPIVLVFGLQSVMKRVRPESKVAVAVCGAMTPTPTRPRTKVMLKWFAFFFMAWLLISILQLPAVA